MLYYDSIDSTQVICRPRKDIIVMKQKPSPKLADCRRKPSGLQHLHKGALALADSPKMFSLLLAYHIPESVLQLYLCCRRSWVLIGSLLSFLVLLGCHKLI
jgi:hypothetical protein